MQRERSALDSFPEPIDLNQGSFPNSTSMDSSNSLDNMRNPAENRVSNYMLASDDGNVGCTNAANECAQSFSGWDRGGSSSRTNNPHCTDGSTMGHGWLPSMNSFSGSGASSESWSFEPSNMTSTTYVGNQVTGRSLNIQSHSSNSGSRNISSNHGHVNGCNRILGAGLPHNLCKSGHSGTQEIPTFCAYSSKSGASSGGSDTFLGSDDALSPPFGTWGSSCKRKALEVTSGLLYPGGSSSSNQPKDKNIMQHPVPGCYSAPRTLSISSGTLKLSPTNQSEQLNASTGVGMSRVTPGFFPSSSVSGITESSGRNLSIKSNPGRLDSVPCDAARGNSVRNFGTYTTGLISNNDPSELRSPMTPPMNPNTVNQTQLLHANDARGMHPYPWLGSYSSQGGNSSISYMVSGESASRGRDEVHFRNPRGNNVEYPMAFYDAETRNILQDQIDWSFAPGTSSSSRNHSSGSRIGSNPGGRGSSVAWLPHQPQISQNHQRLSETAPWIPFPRIDSESGSRRSHFALLPFASSSSDEAAATSHAQHQLGQSPPAPFDVPGDDINNWRAMAAIEGRHFRIRQVLNAMRRGVHLQSEDYMLIDPFVSGFAETRDRHRDMRLDVDNMSYEELLALEERIGNVNTGLSEEKIRVYMKQRTYEGKGVSPNLEPCCICQEDYMTGEAIGILDCAHEFHTGCIKQWLTLKNLCPICKMTALEPPK